MLQSIQITEAAMLMDDIASAGYKIRQQTLIERPNVEFLWNMILIKDESPFQPVHNFSIEVDRTQCDDIGVLVLTDVRPTTKATPDRLVLVNIKLRSQSAGTGSSYSDLIQQALKQTKIKLRSLGVRNYRIVLAGNFLDNPNSLQLQEIKRESKRYFNWGRAGTYRWFK